MCGICGFVGIAQPDVLKRMRDALTHRGPDESGDYVDGRVHLGHTRLSVIDLESGQQPFESDDGSTVVVFNGEIYNHDELRSRLEGRGHRFRTKSDTESIVHAYREYGERCPEHLDGMFAFVIYDKSRRTLFGARDRFGKKPLFYSVPRYGEGRAFVFASEIRSLLLHPAVRSVARISRDGVIAYLLHDYSPGVATIYENIQRMPAGHAFHVAVDGDIPDQLDSWSYWQNPITAAPSSTPSESMALADVDRLLDAAVERRLMSEVPLGVFLSGGVDSAAIVAFLSRHVHPPDIQTFSIGFDDPSFDETAYAQSAAEYYGTRHHARQFTARECLAEIEACFNHMDEPFADPSILPTSLLARFARGSVTVALGGDGGDELFAGYDPFRALGPARIYDMVVPRWLDRTMARALPRVLPTSGANMSLAFRADRFLRGAKVAQGERMATWMGAFDAPGIAALVPDTTATSIREQFLDRERALSAALSAQSADAIRLALAYFQTFYLADDILVKTDRASMMHSLELRSPFLDTALAEYVNSLPSRLKYRRGVTKYLLRKLLSRQTSGRPMVPDWLLRRPKKGFGIPVSRWIRRELREELQTRLVLEWPESLTFLDRRRIETLLQQHVCGVRDNWKELWALFVLGEWARRWAS